MKNHQKQKSHKNPQKRKKTLTFKTQTSAPSTPTSSAPTLSKNYFTLLSKTHKNSQINTLKKMSMKNSKKKIPKAIGPKNIFSEFFTKPKFYNFEKKKLFSPTPPTGEISTEFDQCNYQHFSEIDDKTDSNFLNVKQMYFVSKRTNSLKPSNSNFSSKNFGSQLTPLMCSESSFSKEIVESAMIVEKFQKNGGKKKNRNLIEFKGDGQEETQESGEDMCYGRVRSYSQRELSLK